MEALESTVVSVGKSVLDIAVRYVESTIAKEVALQLGIHRDQAFISDELEMMQGFLMTAHDDRDNHNRVVKIWVKQVRNVAYEVDDCLYDFVVRLEKPSWWPWRITRTLLDQRRVANRMKELRAKVEDVSHRNVRYHLIKAPSCKTTSTAEQPAIGRATMSGSEEARRQQDEAKLNLVGLINMTDDDLRVIAVSGTSATDLEETSFIKRAYEDVQMHKKFECHAWIRLMCPFNLTKTLQSIVQQFYVNHLQEAKQREKATTDAQVLRRMVCEQNEEDLANEFKRYVNEKSYLIVLHDLHTTKEWGSIKTCFPQNKKRSRIIVSTEHVGVASLCVVPHDVALEHKQLFSDLYVFYYKGTQDGTHSTERGSSSNTENTGSGNSADGKSLNRAETMVTSFKEPGPIGREEEKSDIMKLIMKEDSQQLEVISVWGMGGLGKTTLVKDVYQSLSGKFEKRACVTIMHPFDSIQLIKTLAMQLGVGSNKIDKEEFILKKDKEEFLSKKHKEEMDLMTGKTKAEALESVEHSLRGRKYLIVLDDLSSSTEWDAIKPAFSLTPASRIIITTREMNIAKHCSKKHSNIYNLQFLQHRNACDLFTEKVFGKITNLEEKDPELAEQANLILKKCSGLPLAIVTIGGFLANQQKTALEWRRLNEHISVELETNPELESINTVLTKSYDGLPYHLKSCFLYMPIFPEDGEVSRRRLVRRWIAEGYSYSSVAPSKSAEEMAEGYFKELISRSMLLPCERSIYSRKGVDICQVHDRIRDIGISKSMDENLVFRLEQGCSLNSKSRARHLAVSDNWSGDQIEFESIVDLSHVRSLTVFGLWKPFFISNKMKLLRVLDLEDTIGLGDHHLKHIGMLRHLKYLSLRGCDDIYYLPDSLGNLRQLQTLDVRDTKIIKLSKSIIKLGMLNYLRLGRKSMDEDVSHEELIEGLPNPVRNNKLCLLTLGSAMVCAACCSPKHFDWAECHDICTAACCALLPATVMRLDLYGVLVPRGMRKLKALRTLGVVNIARGGVIQDIKELTRLHKLGVTGINRRNGQEFCSAIDSLNLLESLSIRSEGETGLCGSLDGVSSPPTNLQSLKLYGNLVELPGWIHGLKNLVKLYLRSTRLLGHDASIQVIGKLPHLAILCLMDKSFQGEELCFQREAFRNLIVLMLEDLTDIKSVKFDQGAMPKLEQIKVSAFKRKNEIGFFGLEFPPSIQEVFLDVRLLRDWSKADFSDANTVEEQMERVEKEAKLKEDRWEEQIRAQLAGNPRKPILKVK